MTFVGKCHALSAATVAAMRSRPAPLRRVHAFAPILCAVLGAPAVQAAPAACDHGTWRGTVGATPVSIELSPAEGERPAMGRYYYRASLADLTLVPDAKTGQWQELDPKEKLTGRLSLSCDASTLSGEWQSVDGAKRLPITASAIKDTDYNATRKAGLKPKVVKTGQVGGQRFEELSFPLPGASGKKDADTDAIHGGIRLAGSTPGIAAVNATLLARSIDAVMDHLDCAAMGRRDRGPDAGFSSSQTQSVLAWNAAFVVINTWNEGYCGGAHPWHDNGVTTYRLDTGAEAEVQSWLRAEWNDEISKDSKLGRLLMKAYAEGGGNGNEAECRDEVRWMGRFIHPAPKELVFHTQASYAMTPCAEDVALPLDAVWPFLTPAGQQALKTFR